MALPPHIPVALKMLPHLIECAKEGRRTSYEEIGKAVHLESRLLARPLAFIRDFICANHNLPPLTLVVQKRGPDTSSNSFDPKKFDALSAKDYKKLESKMLQSVYAYPRWDLALSGLQEKYPLN